MKKYTVISKTKLKKSTLLFFSPRNLAEYNDFMFSFWNDGVSFYANSLVKNEEFNGTYIETEDAFFCEHETPPFYL